LDFVRERFEESWQVCVDPGSNRGVVFLSSGDIPFPKVGCAAAGVDVADAGDESEGIPEVFAGGIRDVWRGHVGVLFMVHGFGGKADDSNVAMVLEEVVLVAEEFTEEFRIFAAERVWNEGHDLVGEAFFDDGSEEISMGALCLDVDDVALDFAVCEGAVDSTSSEEEVWNGGVGSDAKLFKFGGRHVGDLGGDGREDFFS
jgi:hypothetical protein